MKIKVCGMRNPENIIELSALHPDFMGFIFYKKSPRYVGDLLPEILTNISAKKVGVFVNEGIQQICSLASKYNLDAIQLHGKESVETCKLVKRNGLICIKAFSIEKPEDFEASIDYDSCADFFLFDTKTPAYGGSGQKFDWSILEHYKGKKNFFLSGGISLEDVENIKALNHPKLYCVDINSKFETEPAMKNIEQIKIFFQQMRA